jgi:hypothetical protein
MTGGGFGGGAKGSVFSYSRKTYFGNFKQQKKNEETYQTAAKQPRYIFTSHNATKSAADS